MSQQQQAGHSIVDIYKGVINDVISQVKEAFLDENIDVDVLQQLKKDWEEKLSVSGAVDWEGTTRQVAPPPLRQVKPSPVISGGVPPGSAVRIAQNGQQILVHHSPALETKPGAVQLNQPTVVVQTSSSQGMQRSMQQVQYISANALPISTEQSGNIVMQRQQMGQGPSQLSQPPTMITIQPGQGPARIVQQGGQQFIMHGGGTANLPPGSNVMILNAGTGQQLPVTLSNATIYQTTSRTVMQTGQANPKQEEALSLLDGSGGVLEFEVDVAGPSKRPRLAKKSKTIKKKKGITQLDGVSRVSDSSSDEDDLDEDDEDDPLRSIADRIEGEGNVPEDEEQVVEEDPLNSGDDQSDDEDVDRLFEAENLIMCQFEKVHRARNKWKFTLKDGIMHINGKDHCFQRCSGEAEW